MKSAAATCDKEHGEILPHCLNSNWNIFLTQFSSEWPEHRKEIIDAIKKINEMHVAIADIGRDTKHLSKLEGIHGALQEVKDCLIHVLSGKDVISTDTAKEMLQAQQKTYAAIITSLCKVFGVIFIVVIGLRIFLPEWFK